jgi:putative CocE/NonD family hydrolase
VPPAAIDPERAVAAGYALVCQDVRGQYGSDGEFATFLTEGDDSYDTVEWAAAQPWCDGSVGMSGRSYGGAVQWLGATRRPPHLRAIFPVVTGSDYYEGWIYQGGAFQLGFNLFWARLMTEPRSARKLDDLYRHLPLRTVPIARDTGPGRSYLQWLDHPTDDWYWEALSINRRYERVEVPAFNVAGWFDIFLGGTLENFVRLRREGGSEAARTGTRLVVGPWAHGSTYGSYPDHSFPRFAGADRVDLDELQLAFFDEHVRGGPGGDGPPVRLFVMGDGWRDEDDWPLARARPTPWYLRAGGLLSPEGPGDEPPDSYVYDPSEPAPTVGGPTSLPAAMMKTNAGPLDRRRVEARDDVLVYTSEPLREALEATGPLELVLHAATDAPDTDWIASLCDVQPDGASLVLAEGVLRARFRQGFDEERPIEPGAPLEYRLDLVATGNVFAAGNRIRVTVTSSSFPRFDRNPNSGNPLGADGPENLRPARPTVFHDAARPSHVVLPVVPR